MIRAIKSVFLQTCIMIIMLIWLISLLLVMPYAINMRLNYIPTCDFWICSEDWSDRTLQQIFGGLVMTLQVSIVARKTQFDV